MKLCAITLIILCSMFLVACNDKASPALEHASESNTAAPVSEPTKIADIQRTKEPSDYGFEDAMRPGYVSEVVQLGQLTHYLIDIEIDPKDANLTGHQVVNYINNNAAPLDWVVFRLYPNLDWFGGSSKVSQIMVNDEAVESELVGEDSVLRVRLPNPVPPGGEAKISLNFAVSVPTQPVGYGQLLFNGDIVALASFYPIIPALDQDNCSTFGHCFEGWNTEVGRPYGDATYTDIALYDLHITVPEGWVIVASGTTVERVTRDGMTQWHMVTGPMRDIQVVASPRFEISERWIGDIKVSSYFLPEDRAGGMEVLQYSADALSYFDREFSPYPYSEFDVVETGTTAGGIEYPGLIVMPREDYGETGGSFQWATIHEVVHQWWYGLVGNDQIDEPWLDEALTQYSTSLYYEDQMSFDRVVDEVFVERYLPFDNTELDTDISLPLFEYTDANYGPVVYIKGPLFFDSLRREMGDEYFMQLLRTYAKEYRYQNASGADLLALVEQISPSDIGYIIDEWIPNR